MHYILSCNDSLDFLFGLESMKLIKLKSVKLVIYAGHHTEWFTEQLMCTI